MSEEDKVRESKEQQGRVRGNGNEGKIEGKLRRGEREEERTMSMRWESGDKEERERRGK